MSIRCLFGAHRASLHSIARKNDHFTALCESCGRPLERNDDGRWRAAEPLYDQRNTRAA